MVELVTVSSVALQIGTWSATGNDMAAPSS